MYNFEHNAKDVQQLHAPLQSQNSSNAHHLTQSNYSDFPMTSPNPHDIQSFMISTGHHHYTQSPEPHQIKKYTGESPSVHQHIGQSSSVLQDFKTPVNNHTNNINHINLLNKNNYHVSHHNQQQSPQQLGVQHIPYNKEQQHHSNENFQIAQQNKQLVSSLSANSDNHEPSHSGKVQKSTFYQAKDMPLQQNQQQLTQNLKPNQNPNQTQLKQQTETNQQMLINNLDLQKLRQVMKEQYKQYSDEQIEAYLQKFLKEYLTKITQQQKLQNDMDEMFSNNKQGMQSDSDEDDDSDEDLMNSEDFTDHQEDPSRDSLNTNLDWNDKGEIEKYCVKQRRIQEKKDFRPSQYFGAIKVEQLEDGIDDSRIDELFLDVFGIKPKKQKKKDVRRKENLSTQQNQIVTNQQQVQPPAPNNINQGQIQTVNNQGQKDQSCNIVLNIYNQFQFMNQQDAFQKSNVNQVEDQYATVLSDKSNINQKKSACQVLHTDQQNYNMAKQKSMQQDQLKKYMSPAELCKLKHQKATSDPIDLENNDFQKCCFKTDDNRAQQVLLSSKGLSGKSYQTQVSSPQSQNTINRHLYNQSITSTTNLVPGINQSIQSLTHQSSHGNLNLSSGLGYNKSKHQSNLSLNKQAYKNIIYKHHHSNNSNFNSISSQNSIDNKPKQNKLSYLVAKNLPDGAQSSQEHSQNHTRMQSQNNAPKPPQNQTLPITQKMGRDSKDSGKQPYDYVPQLEQTQNFYSENSPQVSPKSTLFNQNQQNAPTSISHFKLNSQTFSMQHANSTFQNVKPNMLQQSMSKDIELQPKTLVQQATENFRKAKQSVQISSNFSNNESLSSHRSNAQKTLGRNQSQNLFMSQNQINTSVQSFLMSSGDQKFINKDIAANNKIQYLDTEEIQTSPKIFNNKYDQVFMSNTSRPQTAINTNFSLATGINQYMNAATNLGKPPSKLHKAGFLSHNSSAKNLKIQTKGNMTITQTAQNSQRKQKTNQTSVQDEFIAQTLPTSSRNMNLMNHTKLASKPLDFTSKERDSIQRPATTKSIDRSKLKSNSIQQQYENDLASIERKKQLIQQHQKQQLHLQSSQEQAKNSSRIQDKKQGQVGRNQSGISKGKSANQISEFISTYQQPKLETQKSSDSQGRMMIKITKSIEKLQQQTKATAAIQKLTGNITQSGISLVSSPINHNLQSKTFNFPQSTKNSSSNTLGTKNQINEMMNQLTSYQSYKKSQIGKSSLHEKENFIASSDSRSIKNQKSTIMNSGIYTSQANSKTRKDNTTYIDPNVHAKKTTDTFKRYLTNGGSQIQNHLNSFK